MPIDRAQLAARLRAMEPVIYYDCNAVSPGYPPIPDAEKRIVLTEAERDALLAALGAEAEPRGWQDISTAPHNRKLVVFYVNALGNGRTVHATFYDAGRLNMSDDCDEDSTDESGMNVHPGWYEESESFEFLQPIEEPPTHWQHLPSQPSSVREEQET